MREEGVEEQGGEEAVAAAALLLNSLIPPPPPWRLVGMERVLTQGCLLPIQSPPRDLWNI